MARGRRGILVGCAKGWVALAIVSVIAVTATAFGGCSGHDTFGRCVIFPCPFPGFDVETCTCRRVDAGGVDAGDGEG